MAEKDHPHAAHRSWGGISKNEVALPSLGHVPQGSLFNLQKTEFIPPTKKNLSNSFPTCLTAIQTNFQLSPTFQKRQSTSHLRQSSNKSVFHDRPWINIFPYKWAVKPQLSILSIQFNVWHTSVPLSQWADNLNPRLNQEEKKILAMFKTEF